MGGTVPVGTPITTGDAVRAILREVKSPVLGNVELDSGPGHTFDRIYGHGRELYDMLSGGERKLVDVAWSLWRPGEGARISDLGGLDRDRRRRVLIVLFYLYLGSDLPWNGIDEVDFQRLFGDRRTAG